MKRILFTGPTIRQRAGDWADEGAQPNRARLLNAIWIASWIDGGWLVNVLDTDGDK